MIGIGVYLALIAIATLLSMYRFMVGPTTPTGWWQWTS